MAFISYFWLNGVKDLIYTCWYWTTLHRGVHRPPHIDQSSARVLLVYCTRNDFNADSLRWSMLQTHPRTAVALLDDSDDPEAMRDVDRFAATWHVPVIRRSNRTGFKAGNLNHCLSQADYDYFVILDSDEVIPNDFVTRALDYFAASPSTGIVQASHIATRNTTGFQQRFSRGVNSHWPVYQAVKDRFGFLSLLGHGAMVSKACYDAAGGFPHVVAEDICFALAARDVGYRTVFARDIVCEEEYPVDYSAFRKRHAKWTEGNMEFIRLNTARILTSQHLRWYEKLDIVLFTYSLPLTALFSLFIVVNVVVLPQLTDQFQYPMWMLAPTALFLIAPGLNDWIYHLRSTGAGEMVRYSVGSALLYGSMFYVSLRSSLRSMFGRSTFYVTPKASERLTFRQAARLARGEIVFACVLTVVALTFTGNALSVMLIVIPSVATLSLLVLHQPKRPIRRDIEARAKQETSA